MNDIDPSGRWITFQGRTTGAVIVDGAPTGVDQVFVHDRVTGDTALVSIDSAGSPSPTNAFAGWLSASGKTIVFSSPSGLDGAVTGETGQYLTPNPLYAP